MRTRRLLLLTPLGFALACDPRAGLETKVTSAPITRLSDYQSLTGTNTLYVDAFSFSTGFFYRTNFQLDALLDPVSGIGPNGPAILGSSLGAVTVDGKALAGRKVMGTELESVDADGTTTRVRVDDIRRSEKGDRDLLYYEVSKHGPEGWEPLCSEGPAIALPGAWSLEVGARGSGGWRDHSGFFFACVGSSVEKCYEMGFKPWKFQVHGETVLNLHEACVRALRADFGGTGSSATTQGVEVVISTERTPQLPDGFDLEAAWSIDGARCRLKERVDGLSQDGDAVPRCEEAQLDDPSTILYTFTRTLDPALVFDLRCDEGSGDAVVERAGERTGTLIGGAGWSAQTPDASAHACAFTGGDARTTFDSIELTGSELTMVSWIKVNSFSGTDPRIISKASGVHRDHHDWMLGFASRGRIRTRVRTDSTTELESSRSISLGVWHHLAVTYDGSEVRMYLDGQLERTAPTTGLLSSRPFAVGVGNQPLGAGDRALDGSIDRLRVYRRALSPTEISRQAEQEGAIYAPTTGDGLAFSLDCEERARGFTVDDVKGDLASLSDVTRSSDTGDGSAQSCRFDGNEARLSFGDVETSGSGLTMLSWVNADAFGNTRDPRILSKAVGEREDDHDWMLGFSSRGHLRARVRTDSTTTVLTSRSLTVGRWQHVAVTYDGSAIRMYIDGQLERSTAKTGRLASRRFGVGVGNQPLGAGNRPFDGRIDGVEVYGRALSASEIASRAAQGTRQD